MTDPTPFFLCHIGVVLKLMRPGGKTETGWLLEQRQWIVVTLLAGGSVEASWCSEAGTPLEKRIKEVSFSLITTSFTKVRPRLELNLKNCQL